MASAVIGGVAAVGKEVWCYIFPKIKNIVKFRSNFECLKNKMGILMITAQSVKEQTEAAKASGRALAPEVLKWLQDFEEIKGKVDLLEAKIEAQDKSYQVYFSHHLLGSKVAKLLIEVKRLIENAKFPLGFVVENFEVEKAEHIPGPSIVNQSSASKNLKRVLDLLNNEDVNIIGVWGMGGVGKTTLVKNLNNMLRIKTIDSDAHFSIIMWVTASKKADLRSLQCQLVQRLNLEEKRGENMESTASRLHQRLKREKRFLFILDDVWEKINLDYLGLSEFGTGNKVILTTRSMDVCRQMKTDIEVKVNVLNEDESWQLFIKNAGTVASHDIIEPIARKISHECSGLPLAINVVGASMRGRTNATLWEDALNALRKSVPHTKDVEEEVYKPLKWSYDSLFFRKMNAKSCFLYCCLYPEDYSINVKELVDCWIGEGLVGESHSYQDMVNTGISMVEYLKDTCLLEVCKEEDTVKMHDVVRDVATWIVSAFDSECKTLVLSGFSTRSISDVMFQENNRRVSLIRCLPNLSKQYPEVLSLLVRDVSLPEIPQDFFQKFPALRVLNIGLSPLLRGLNRRSLPVSLGQLSKLRALLVQFDHCCHFPPLGDLHLLKVLDCSYSDMQDFPEGMENLTNLRKLILLKTELAHIREGVISKLTLLESLDMTGCPYKWDADGTGRTPFNELQSLRRLIFLSISIKMSSSSASDFSWLERVKEFHIIYGEVSWIFEEEQKSYRRTVVLCNVELGGKGFRSLLQAASCAVLDRCHYLERLQVDSTKGYSFSALKSLTIKKVLFEFVHIRPSSKVDLLPNLEKLFLDDVSEIDSVSQLMLCLGSRLPKLRALVVSRCLNVKYLFSNSDPAVPPSKSLEEVTVSLCCSFVGIYENVASTNQKLKKIKMKELPQLTSLFGQQNSWEQLEQLQVIGCRRINELPFTAQSALSLKEIKGERQWWSGLKWDNEASKSSMHCYFRPVKYKTRRPPVYSEFPMTCSPLRRI